MPDPISSLRREPYRLFFPLGLSLAAVGVGHWLLFALRLTTEYRSIFHSMVQVQGFLISFAVGFLFTMLPRRTQTDPPMGWEIVVAAVCPVATVVLAWTEHWAAAQLFWVVLLAVLLRFAAQRLARSAPRRAPSSFVWLPVAFALGLGGAVLSGVAATLDSGQWVLHELGRALVLQGMFVALVLGVGGLAIPLMTRRAPPPDSGDEPRQRWERRLHLVAALLLVTSFVVDAYLSLRFGLALRGAVVVGVLLGGVEIWRPPSRPGLNRWLIWIAAWSLPVGYAVSASFLQAYKGGLHIVFIGGFALLALSVSSRVVLGHGGDDSLNDGAPLSMVAMALAVASALAARILMELQEARLLLWMLVAALSFLVAIGSWAVLLVPRLWSRQRTTGIE